MAPGRRRGRRSARPPSPAPSDNVLGRQPVLDVGGPSETTSQNKAGSSVASTSIGGGCGMTRGIRVRKLLSKGRKIEVNFPDGKHRPVGVGSKEFTTKVGVICREMVPLQVPTWSKIEEIEKEPIFQRLASEFRLDFSNRQLRRKVDSLLSRVYSEHRHRLYKHYKHFPTLEEAQRNPPRDVKQNDWDLLCNYWETNESQVLGRRSIYVRGLGQSELHEIRVHAEAAERHAEAAERHAEAAERHAEAAERQVQELELRISTLESMVQRLLRHLGLDENALPL